jgi:hypothetical protein
MYRAVGITAFRYVRSEVFTAVAMKNAVVWDIKPLFRTSQEAHYVSVTEPDSAM